MSFHIQKTRFVAANLEQQVDSETITILKNHMAYNAKEMYLGSKHWI